MLSFIDAARSKHKSQQQYLGYMMHNSLLVGHIQKLVHVVRTSNVSTEKMRRNKVPGATFMEHDFRLTVGTLTWLSSQKQTSGNIAIGTVYHEQASGNVAVGRSDIYP